MALGGLDLGAAPGSSWPDLVVGVLSGRDLDAFDDRIEPGNHQIAQLLKGEHLVPPPPLPPDVFATAEVEQVRPMLSTADRRWDQMDEAFVQRLLMAFKIMREEHGYDMALLEGYRSPERQNMLAAKGGHVTQAKAWQSYHQYGLAADCAFMRAGKLVISERDPWAMRGYELFGQVAEQIGLTWGGRWQMLDLGHVEWRRPGRNSQRAKPLGLTQTVTVCDRVPLDSAPRRDNPRKIKRSKHIRSCGRHGTSVHRIGDSTDHGAP